MESRNEALLLPAEKKQQENGVALRQAVIAGDLEAFNRLLDDGVDLHRDTEVVGDWVKVYLSPLTLAIKHNRMAMLERLMPVMTQAVFNAGVMNADLISNALNHEYASDVYNKKENSKLRKQLRDWLAEGLTVGVYTLIASGVDDHVISLARKKLASLLSKVNLLQGAGGYFGMREKKTAVVAVEALQHLLECVKKGTEANKKCDVGVALSFAMKKYELPMIQTLLKIMVNYPPKPQSTQTIYCPLIGALNSPHQFGQAFNRHFRSSKKVELRKPLRAFLNSELEGKVERLIQDKAQALSVLNQELDGLNALKNRLAILQDYTGKHKKTAMIQLEQHIDNLQAEIENRKKKIIPEAQLLQAAAAGNVAVVKRLLNEHPNINVDCKTSNGETPLFYAIDKAYVEVVRVLMQRNPKMAFNVSGGGGPTALNLAAYRGNVEIVRILLEAGERDNINKRREDGVTALYLAAQQGCADVVELLIESGANINLAWQDGGQSKETPLGVAISKRHVKTAEILIAGLDNKIRSFILGLAREEESPFSRYQRLIDYVNGEESHYQGCPKLKKVLRRRLTRVLTEHVHSLIESDAEIETLSAAYQGLDEICSKVKLLQGEVGLILKREKTDMINIKALSDRLKTYIDMMGLFFVDDNEAVSQKKDDAAFSVLLPHGYTSLYLAAREGNLELVKQLIEQGANPNEVSTNIEAHDYPTPFEVASHKGHQAVEMFLRDVLNQKIRSLIPGCPEAKGLKAGDYTALINYLNREMVNYRGSQYLRIAMRSFLCEALRETVRVVARDGDRLTIEAVRSGLKTMKQDLDVIQGRVYEILKDNAAMAEIKDLIKLLKLNGNLIVSRSGLYSVNFSSAALERKVDRNAALTHLNSL